MLYSLSLARGIFVIMYHTHTHKKIWGRALDVKPLECFAAAAAARTFANFCILNIGAPQIESGYISHTHTHAVVKYATRKILSRRRRRMSIGLACIWRVSITRRRRMEKKEILSRMEREREKDLLTLDSMSSSKCLATLRRTQIVRPTEAQQTTNLLLPLKVCPLFCECC